MYEISGRVKVILEAQTFTSGFQKREFVVTTQEKYPQDVKLECIQDKVAMLDGLQEGDDVNAKFNVRGNEYQGRYFVNLQAWDVKKSTGQAPAEMAQTPADASPMPEEDDLPF
jgi:hypothetical protein